LILEASSENLAHCAAALLREDLVVMPTETVYGLAGLAQSSAANRRIYEVKSRPSENPLIVHVGSIDNAKKVASTWTASADKLTAEFWPGPLTIVLPADSELGTVAIRMPAHPVALRLLELVGEPIVAPSANVFTRLSPTRSEDVSSEISQQVFAILDGGPCEVGIESTIVDCRRSDSVAILRSGSISRADIEQLIPVVDSDSDVRVPGQYKRHYAPKIPVRLVEVPTPEAYGLTILSATIKQIPMPREPRAYASRLYAALHQMEEMNPPEIEIQTPPRTSEWAAVCDRLNRMVG
jgi:L-threonylcarbamoyladenylate synthase